MAYHDDLLGQAADLAYKNPANPTQADLRRAVSTAYYAVFHLLISETVLNWSRDSSRDALGRMFDHNLMRKASKRVADTDRAPFSGEDPAMVQHLRSVARTFVQLQDKRHIADYDNTTVWTQGEAVEEVTNALVLFETWDRIKHEDIAQEYLVALLIRPRD